VIRRMHRLDNGRLPALTFLPANPNLNHRFTIVAEEGRARPSVRFSLSQLT
jgi:hypothetical protein